MITLYSFGPNFNLVDPSPFVLKTHFLLKQSKQPFAVQSGTQYLQKAPKGKLPYITDNGKTIADSFFIQQYLKDEYDFDIDAHLSAAQKANSQLICKSLEDSLVWSLVYFRWAYESNWRVIKDTFFSDMPFPLSKIVPNIARKGILKAMHGQGISRHTEQEILQIASEQFASLSTLLGDKAYFYNNQLSLLDICAYSVLAQILLAPLASPLQDLAKQYSNLVSFCENMHNEYYSDNQPTS